MITKKQWLEICEKIHSLRIKGKKIYYKDWLEIVICDYKNGRIILQDDTKLVHKSFVKIQSVKQVLWHFKYVEIHKLNEEISNV